MRSQIFIGIATVFLTVCAPVVFAAEPVPPEPQGYFVNPIFVPNGKAIIATNENYSALYLISTEDGSMRELICELGCGFRPSFSPDGKYVGVKIIRDDGMQIPCLLSLETGEVKKLNKPVPAAGEVSFSRDGKIAFTIGNELVLIDNQGRERTLSLGTYANIAPISPDGRYVAFNDEYDQIWIINIETGERKKITRNDKGYFMPQWSPDGKKILLSSLDEYIKVIDIETGKEYDLGKGTNPRWSPDGIFIIYHLEEAEELIKLIGTDIWISRYDGKEKFRVTSTPDIFETDPCFSPDGKKIVFTTYGNRQIFMAHLSKSFTIDSLRLIRKEEKGLKIKYRKDKKIKEGKSLDVPYIHQLYDTPDWFNGEAACAPTTAMMAIVYYRKLPKWDCTVSIPYPHTSHWGRYICEQYNYYGVTYSWVDRLGYGGKGGMGYMWRAPDYRPYTTMHTYFSNHGLTSIRTDNPTWATVVAELNQNYPYALCCSLTSAGHLILAVGYPYTGTLICNDPYGNKNTPPYPNYNGKDVRYDWPGYNSGYVNLRRVYWGTSARGTFPTPTDTIVDDLAIEDGFYLHTSPPASMRYWWDALIGYRGHMWWTYTTASTTEDTCYATYTPNLPQSGNYEVFAYIPSNNATATSARYKIYYSGGNQTVIINQNQHSDEWVSLGTYFFNAGQSGYVRLGDATGVAGQKIGFDAVKWSYRGVRDVGCSDIYAPSGTIDSTQSVTPSARVYNYGNTTESYTVRMRIGNFYDQRVNVTAHTPGTYQTINFPTYSNWPRGTYTVSCSTELANDVNRTNDKRTGSVTVRVKDVGVIQIVSPRGTIDSGTTIVPQVRVQNFGNTTETFPVTFTIGTFYSQTRNKTLSAGAIDTVNFPFWTVTQRGTHTTKCSTALTGDMNPINNRLLDSVTVRVRDVGVIQIIAPSGTIDSGTLITPQAIVKNYGSQVENFPVTFKIGTFYTNTQNVTNLNPGDSMVISFASWTAVQRGTHTTKCTTALTGDVNPANNSRTGSVMVRVLDVGVASILAPSGMIDSGATVTPRVKVKNFGNASASFLVWFRIHFTDNLLNDKIGLLSDALGLNSLEEIEPDQIYEDSLWLTLSPGDSVVRDFRFWTATIPETYRLESFTLLSGDMNRRNDSAFGSVVVRRPIHDAGVIRILAPIGIIDSGELVIPKAVVQNFGQVSENFSVRFQIGTFYISDTVMNLPTGRSDTARFTPWIATQIGSHITKCTTRLSGDINPANDFVRDSVRVQPHVGQSEPNFIPVLPKIFTLDNCSPNPFASKTIIQYAIPKDCWVNLEVYNSSGIPVRSLKAGFEKAGSHRIIWDGYDEKGERAPNGIYFYRLKADEFTAMRKVVKVE